MKLCKYVKLKLTFDDVIFVDTMDTCFTSNIIRHELKSVSRLSVDTGTALLASHPYDAAEDLVASLKLPVAVGQTLVSLFFSPSLNILAPDLPPGQVLLLPSPQPDDDEDHGGDEETGEEEEEDQTPCTQRLCLQIV